MVLRIEQVRNLLIGIDIVQYLLQEVQAQVAVRAQFVTEGPHDTVEDDVEVGFIQRVEKAEVEFDEGFEKGEEVCADLWKGVEVGGDEGEAAGEDHFQEVGQEVGVNDNAQLL
jgi:hypothetical protein